MNEVIVERGEYLVAFLKRFALLEFVGLAVAQADSVEGGVQIKFQNKDVIGKWSKLLVDSTNLEGIKTPHSLIGHS